MCIPVGLDAMTDIQWGNTIDFIHSSKLASCQDKLKDNRLRRLYEQLVQL